MTQYYFDLECANSSSKKLHYFKFGLTRPQPPQKLRPVTSTLSHRTTFASLMGISNTQCDNDQLHMNTVEILHWLTPEFG